MASGLRATGVHGLLGARACATFLALLAWPTGFACGGVYEELAPAQKSEVRMVFVPDFVRVGASSIRLAAFVDTPRADSFVTQIELGEDVVVLGFDSQLTNPCSGIAVPDEISLSDPFLLCITLSVASTAAVGERLAHLELRSDGVPVLASAKLFVLRQIE